MINRDVCKHPKKNCVDGSDYGDFPFFAFNESIVSLPDCYRLGLVDKQVTEPKNVFIQWNAFAESSTKSSLDGCRFKC